MAADILIVDDEKDIRSLIQGILDDEGYATRTADGSDKAYQALQEKTPDLLILDIWLQGSAQDGMDILKKAKKDHPFLPVLMISGHGTIETAVSAIKQGAYDFIEKPFKADRLLLMITRALEAASLKRENAVLREKTEGAMNLVGESSAVKTLRQTLQKIAPTASRVLITGESGTGKEVVARTLHKLSDRSAAPFVSLNCAVLHPERIEEELFGKESSGVVHPGVLEQANGGTLLLDEVADMPLETQGKILHALQSQKFTRVNGTHPISADVRIIASTSRHLPDEIEQGSFRQDLYYRLNVVPITLPALRDRAGDIPELVGYFSKQYSRQSGQPACVFSPGAMLTLKSYPWPGNVRQLKNAIEWVMIMRGGDEGEISREQLPPDIIGPSGEPLNALPQMDFLSLSLREAREAFERDYLARQVSRFSGNISETAKFVGMERSALHRKLKSLEISAHDKQDEPVTDISADISRKRA